MDTKHEKVVGLAVKNGYSLERFQEILAQNNYSQADIDAASELYNVKKKGTSPSESPEQGVSTEFTPSSLDANSSSVSPSTGTSQGADYALGSARQEALDEVSKLDFTQPLPQIEQEPTKSTKEQEDLLRSQNDTEGYLEIARKRQEKINNINRKLEEAVTPGQKLALGSQLEQINA